MKKNFLVMLMLMLVQIVSAANVVPPTRINGIFYNLDANKKQAEVTYNWDDAQVPERKTYKGTITIPATVSYQGITYNVTSIDNMAFFNSPELKAVNLPNSILHIGWNAFGNCKNLKSLTIPKSVTDIDYRILSDCDAITSITVDKENNVYDSRNNCNAIIHTATNELIQGCQNTVIPNTVTRIGDKAFCGIRTLTSIDIPNSVSNIGDEAFYNTGIKEIVFPNSVLYLGLGAFCGCDNLTSVTLSESLESIPDDAFASCNIKSVIIPASVVSIENRVFDNLSSNVSIYFQSTTPPYIEDNAFEQKFNGWDYVTIHVPIGYKDAYEKNDAWKNFTIIDDVVVPENTTGILTLHAPRKGINIINGKKINIK